MCVCAPSSGSSDGIEEEEEEKVVFSVWLRETLNP